MTGSHYGDGVDLTGVVCPFHAAVANPHNAQRAGSPHAAIPGSRNSLSLLYAHARFHASMDKKTAVMTMLVGILGGTKWRGVVRNLVTWSYDPAELESSPLNKHPLNSGLMSRALPGTLDEDRLMVLLTDYGSDYSPADGSLAERGVSGGQLDIFLDAVAAGADVSDRKRKIGRKLANAEIPTVLKVWPSLDVSGSAYVGEATLRWFYGEHRFPRSR